jgi:hypothetical protein
MKRRKFIENISLGTVGITFSGLPKSLYGSNENIGLQQDVLKLGFLNPPASAKPQTWWHWREGRISKEGITAELEAMKRIGLGGVTMFSSKRMGEEGQNVLCLTPEWHECVKHALKECDRLGLSFNFQNCAGWSGSGGPWITPDKNMMRVVFTKHIVEAGATLELEAPPSWPEKGNTYYRDIALLAYPMPEVYKSLKELPRPKVTSNCIENPDRLYKFVGGKPKTNEYPELSIDYGNSAWVQFEFPTRETCRSIKILGSRFSNPDEHRAIILAGDDENNFHEVVQLSTYISLFHHKDASITHAIPKTTAKFFRLLWDGPAKLNLSNIVLSSEPVVNALNRKIGELGCTFISEPILPTEVGTAVPIGSIVDLTNRLDEQKKLKWTAPSHENKWIVIRVGYQNTGKENAPAANEVTGLECDKFNAEAVEFHFNHYASEIIKDAADVNSKNLTGITFDSWEAESQNWSPVFREEFRKRRGYDVLNYLPAFAGYITESRELTDRFLCDVRQTMSDLVSETFFGGMTKLAHKHGLQVHAEDSGGGGETMVSDPVQHYLHVDIPMNEFGNTMKYAASAAHLTGKSVVATEAYTQGRADWQSCPASLKAKGDEAFCDGVNRLVFHTYTHNPDVHLISPGPAFGPYGLAFSRGQTWWEMGHSWISYLSRCQFLLQQGKPCVDVLYFYGEEPGGPIPMVLEGGNEMFDKKLRLPQGYDYDLLPPETLKNDVSFKDGKFITKGGASYKLLVLRSSYKMSPEVAEKIKKLVQSGATVLGPRPTQSPGLNNYPQCDKIVAEIGKEVWGNCDGKTTFRHSYGKGQVVSGLELKEVLESMSLLPDFSVVGIDQDVRFIHHSFEGTDTYFISNGKSVPVNFTAKFRISEKKPEIWDPVAGEIKQVLSFSQIGNQTVIPMWLDSCASVFVVFNKSASSQNMKKSYKAGLVPKSELVLNNPWNVKFSPGWGVPESIKFEKLKDWSKMTEKAIKYYSGLAVYSTSFNWNLPVSNEIYLDLGRVEVIAGVKLNGKECGIAWTPPYRVDISDALLLGENQLEIRVANTWLNRLMGDGLHIDMGSEKHTWTTCNPFTVDPELTVPDISTRSMLAFKDLKREPVPSGLIGPVRIWEL